MKKRIGILYLILFIILALGITTSIGAGSLTVTKNTTAQAMLDALAAGKTLTGINTAVKKANESLYCDARYISLWTNAHYTANGNLVTLPGNNPKAEDSNDYAKVYILAAPGYVKEDLTDNNSNITSNDERQYAWHRIEGEGKTSEIGNDLYNMAIDYQTYKKSEVTTRVTKPSDERTTIVGENAIYGPIKITYSYGTATHGEKTDEWGGFCYAFFDEEGSNVTDRLKLCTLNNGTYIPINATQVQITVDGQTDTYYQIKENTYNNVDIYAVTSDFTLGNVSLKILNNQVEYSAEIQEIIGTVYQDGSYTPLCSECRNKVASAVTTAAAAVAGGVGTVVNLEGSYYTYTGETTDTYYSSGEPSNRYQLGGTTVYFGTAKATGKSYVKCSCGTVSCTAFHYQPTYDEMGLVNGSECLLCGWSTSATSGAGGHVNKSHRTTYKEYTVTIHNFSAIGSCGNSSDKGGSCGSEPLDPGYYTSQPLKIIKTATKNVSNELVLDVGIEFLTSVDVKKVWLDNNNSYGTRPTEITVKLLANNADTGKTLTLTEPDWSATFEELRIRDDNGNEINYTVQEVTDVTEYRYEQKGITGDQENGYTITNMLKTEVAVQKVWDDQADLDEFRPESITVKLLANGADTGKTLTLTEPDWSATFTNLDKCDANGNVIVYTVKEISINKYTVSGEADYVDDTKTGLVAVTITNAHTPSYEGYIEIKGNVWCDGEAAKSNDINGIYGSEDSPLAGITVILRDAEGDYFNTNNKTDGITSTTVTDSKGKYTIKVNVDTTKDVYKLHKNPAGGNGYETLEERLAGAYVEFVYDANKYTTINYASDANATSSANKSKAKENETARTTFDKNYSEYPKGEENVEETITACNAEKLTASTKGIISFGEYLDKDTNQTRKITLKYGYGTRYIRTNPDGAWNEILNGTHEELKTKTGKLKEYDVNVTVFQNVNLGLFEREQPDVALHSDIRKVEVEINSQRYTYMYGIDTEKYKNDITTRFQNKVDSTYEMPVNPADVASLNENKTTMDVYVTYEIEVANLSNTLTTTVDEIVNNYDSDYTIESITYGKMNEDTGKWEGDTKTIQIPSSTPKDGYNEITLSGLGITITEDQDALDEKIYIRYKINQDQISRLFEEEAPLNNASEIIKYSIQYGEETLYAEERKNSEVEKSKKRNAYGGYDYDSQPGNAGFYIDETDKNKIKATTPQDDDDIAPSFVLCKDEKGSKTLSGTIWEDTDVIIDDKERLGNGKDDGSANEARVQNVKVELYNIDGTPAELYNNETEEFEYAVAYSDANGEYALKGVVTGEYFIKFTYGDDTSETELKNGATTMDGGLTKVNARNYKSTIITDEDLRIKEILSKEYASFSEEEKIWHLKHKDGYSVAVDNMLDRLEIPDLQYSNFNDDYTEPQNMTAYTKPFKTLVEFESEGTSQADEEGRLENDSNNLTKLDFGIIERPREDLFVEKTITYFKLKLANGQELINGDPGTQKLNYVKAMGLNQEVTSGAEARTILPRRLLAEIDSELIQGAEIEIDYKVKVTNNNEIDYDYGVAEYYTDIIGNVESGQADKYITTNSNANYYYYGKHDGLNKTKAEIMFIDYIDKDLIYQEDTSKWVDAKTDDLKNEGLINPEAAKLAAPNNGEYKALVSATEPKLVLAIGESSTERSMSARKVLTNESENTYDNGLEIIRIDGKTARTIQESRGGEQITKTYKPGNYVPGLSSGIEQDDDKVDVLITPPTGLTTNYMVYAITGLVGLILILAGVIIIKKKVIIK